MINENNQEVPEVDEIDEIVEEQDEQGNDATDWKALALKNQGIAKRYKTQMEKAKAEAEAKPVEIKPSAKSEIKKNQDELSSRDIFALTKANINEEDVDEILDYMKYRKVSMVDALKSNTLRGILKERDEQRNVANATNVGTSKRGTSIISDTTLLDNARKGELPESDADMARLVTARWKK
jgi:hypothetical protein